jgi:hypothetical protein
MGQNQDDNRDLPWEHSAQSKPFVDELLARIAFHSPELVVLIKQYLESNDETLVSRRTYDGTDASMRTVVVFAEAVLAFEQLRAELSEQVVLHRDEDGDIPSHLTLAMSDAMTLEPVLIQCAKMAFDLHLKVWNAHAGAVRPPYDTKHLSDYENRGRWSGHVKDEEGS